MAGLCAGQDGHAGQALAGGEGLGQCSGPVFLTLAFPHPDLSPNRAKGRHWTATARLKTEQKETAFLATKSAIAGTKPQWPARIPVAIVFCPKDKRHRDFDNLLAASNSALDGIALALGIDDRRFGPFWVDVQPGDGKTEIAVGLELVSANLRDHARARFPIFQTEGKQ